MTPLNREQWIVYGSIAAVVVIEVAVAAASFYVGYRIAQDMPPTTIVIKFAPVNQ
jgi:hypothetical protein